MVKPCTVANIPRTAGHPSRLAIFGADLKGEGTAPANRPASADGPAAVQASIHWSHAPLRVNHGGKPEGSGSAPLGYKQCKWKIRREPDSRSERRSAVCFEYDRRWLCWWRRTRGESLKAAETPWRRPGERLTPSSQPPPNTKRISRDSPLLFPAFSLRALSSFGLILPTS